MVCLPLRQWNHMRKRSLFTSGFDLQATRWYSHQCIEVVHPKIHKGWGFYYTPSAEVYCPWYVHVPTHKWAARRTTSQKQGGRLLSQASFPRSRGGGLPDLQHIVPVLSCMP